MTVIGVGETTLDTTYHLPGFVQEDQKTAATEITRSVGGPVPAGLMLLQRLGLDCQLFTQLGSDPEGTLVRRKLLAEQLHLSANEQLHTKHNLYLVNAATGTRTGVKSPVTHAPLTLAAHQLRDVAQASLLLLDRHEPAAAGQALATVSATTVVLMDPSTDASNSTLELLLQTSVPIAPIELLKKAFPNQPLEHGLHVWYKQARKPIVVTAGSAGCVLYDGKLHHIPPVVITAVDTLGAGDVFRAAVGYGLLQQWPLLRVLQYANLVAGLQCCKPGNGSAIPSKAEIQTLQRSVAYKPTSLIQVSQYYQSLRV